MFLLPVSNSVEYISKHQVLKINMNLIYLHKLLFLTGYLCKTEVLSTNFSKVNCVYILP
jgi:hypothetical protein